MEERPKPAKRIVVDVHQDGSVDCRFSHSDKDFPITGAELTRIKRSLNFGYRQYVAKWKRSRVNG